MLTLRSVGMRYGAGPSVLDGVDLSLPPGAIALVEGGNGSGKSTLLRIAAGISRPTTGVREFSERGQLGYIPERFPADERLSAKAYLTHMGRIRGLTTRAAHSRAGELLDRLNLTGGYDTQIRQLSKGNAQKVAVAQALLVRPALLVLDEPWAGLDAEAHDVLADLITEAAGAGAAVLYAEHSISTASGASGTAVEPTAAYRIIEGRLTTLNLDRERFRALSTVMFEAQNHSGRTEPRSNDDEQAPPTSRPESPESIDWSTLPGVEYAHEEDDGRVRVAVERDSCDALLLAALGKGWSVAALVHNNSLGDTDTLNLHPSQAAKGGGA